ncbi:YceI family protein [Phenylobacterium sp. LjRoot225]|uniref:YceI family protein n=1 Tax=Phenylobacterium sp. LjRoot225 TaxID=3342285 RepID=UPI003ED045EB
MQGPANVESTRYSTTAIVLHWLIAAGIVLQVALASRMEGPPTPAVFAVAQLHKSIGITLLLLSLARLAWRLIHPPARLPSAMPRWERELARLVHVGFYLVMIGLPLTGWIMVSASRFNLPTLLYGVVPWPDLPGLSTLAPAAKTAWREFGEVGHGLLVKATYGLLALHVAGALKHQLFSRDEPVLARIAPGARPGRWLEPRLLLILVGFVTVIGFGRLVRPPLPAAAGPAAAAVIQQNPVAPPEPAEAAQPAPPAQAAADNAPPQAAKPPAEPGRWAVQPGSTVAFAVPWSDQTVQGRFDRWRGDILFSPEALDRSRVNITMDLASVNTGDAQRDATLASADWFDEAAHPPATFTASRFEKTGPDRFVAHGVLELRGVKKPVDLPFRLKIAGDTARVTGSAVLDRTAFGVGQGEWAATDQIAGQVRVSVDLTARRK